MRISADGLTLEEITNDDIDANGQLKAAIPNSVTSIGGMAFQDCTSLTSITIPNSVTQIGSGAFWCCTSLASITIPNSVKQIGNSAFKGCTNLSSITIPDSVTYIGRSAFQNCTSLTSITIPDSVTQISSYAFSGCTSLTSITLPNSVTHISDYAFYRCPSLTQIIIDSDNDNEIARITALLPDELQSKVITEHQVANQFGPKDGGWAVHSLFWQAAKAVSQLDAEEVDNVKHIPQLSEAINAAKHFAKPG